MNMSLGDYEKEVIKLLDTWANNGTLSKETTNSLKRKATWQVARKIIASKYDQNKAPIVCAKTLVTSVW